MDGSQQIKGRHVAGWYLQQFLKMWAGHFVENLSEHYLVWDMDMLLVRNLEVFKNTGKKSGGFSWKTIVNIGGATNPGYEYSYHTLTNRSMEFAPDGTSFVTHWMVVYQPHMNEFLTEIIPPTRSDRIDIPLATTSSTEWVWKILDSLLPTNVETGFSEYASYISWVKQNYPSSQFILKKCAFRRSPIGASLALNISRLLTKDHICCPVPSMMKIMHFFQYQYMGFEIGHFDFCQYTHQKFSDGYGV